MDRIKVAVQAVIAVALVALAAERWMPEARAQGGDISCNAWYGEMINGLKGQEKAVELGRAHAEQVRTWLLQNPGEPVFRTTMVHGAGSGYIDVMCVRN